MTKDFLETNNIVHRANTVGCPEQNGKIERFHQTLKRLFRYGLPWDCSPDLLQYNLNLFLHYYNYRKRHRGTWDEWVDTHAEVGRGKKCYLDAAVLQKLTRGANRANF